MQSGAVGNDLIGHQLEIELPDGHVIVREFA